MFVGIYESVHGIGHDVHALAICERLTERAKLGGGYQESENNVNHLSVTSVLLSMGDGLLVIVVLLALNYCLHTNHKQLYSTTNIKYKYKPS
jgi:hypothetical protein